MANQNRDEWQTVAEESATRIVFDTVGDEFIGTYLGHEMVGPDKDFDYLMFRGTNGQMYSTSASWKLNEAFGKISEGSMVRITYLKDVPMGSGRNPMKDFRVDVKS